VGHASGQDTKALPFLRFEKLFVECLPVSLGLFAFRHICRHRNQVNGFAGFIAKNLTPCEKPFRGTVCSREPASKLIAHWFTGLNGAPTPLQNVWHIIRMNSRQRDFRFGVIETFGNTVEV